MYFKSREIRMVSIDTQWFYLIKKKKTFFWPPPLKNLHALRKMVISIFPAVFDVDIDKRYLLIYPHSISANTITLISLG